MPTHEPHPHPVSHRKKKRRPAPARRSPEQQARDIQKQNEDALDWRPTGPGLDHPGEHVGGKTEDDEPS